MALALGGKVDKMEQRKKDPRYYLVGLETVTFKKEFFELDFVKAT